MSNTTIKAKAQGIALDNLEQLVWLGDIPALGAQRVPERDALIFAERGTRLGYADLERYSNAFALELQRLGLQAGERIAYLGRNSDLFFPVLFGCIRAGVVLVPLNWRQAAAEIAYQLEDSTSRYVLVDETLMPLAEQAIAGMACKPQLSVVDGAQGGDNLRARLAGANPVQVLPASQVAEQTVLQVYTSGTTGQPKGVQISHHALSLARHAECIAPDWADWLEGEVSLSAMPNFHVGGMSWVLIGLVRQSTVVITADPMPGNMLKLLREYQAQRSFIVPTVIRAIVDELHASGEPAPQIKGIYYGAMPMSVGLLREAMELFNCRFGQFFGMTELTGTATYLAPSEHDLARPERLKSVGRPIAGMSLEIRDGQRRVVDVGVPGEIWIKAPTLMQGYWQLPEKTAEAVVDGWYASGDGGYLDAEGFLYLTDRIKDMIVTGGENVYPVEVEEALMQHPSVLAAAVVGLPDERWGEVVAAVVELRPGQSLDQDALREHVRGRIAGYKCPKAIHFGELPRTASGKIQRALIRSRLRAAQ